MTPQQKTEKLVNKFYETLPQWVNREDAKQCALIAVDEILNNPDLICNTYYWEQVKSEIEKL